MKLGVVVSVFLLLIALVPISLQDASQDTAVADQTWHEEFQPEEYRGENAGETPEEEPVRKRKRRRRLRKRPRIQHQEDEERPAETDLNPEATQDRVENEESVTAVDPPRRRPGKRRRRPYRRYQEDEGPPKRRRRKGGRKKRPQVQEEIVQTDAPQEQRMEDEMETTTFLIPTTVPPTVISIIEEEKPTVIPKFQFKPVKKEESEDLKTNNNDVKNENEDSKPTGYGNKIFDRKKLFSNPRRTLPVTSAVIRKFGSNTKNNSETTTPQGEPRENNELKLSESVLVKSNVPHETTKQPEVLRPEKLVNIGRKLVKTQQQEPTTTEKEDEEPNYPKFPPRPIFNRNRYKIIETTTIPQATEKIETTIKPEVKEEPTTVPPSEMPMSDTEFEKMLDNLDLAESYNLTSFDDFVLELLKSKSGKEHLSKILESRNMTIQQLLDHRERGSSKFHLFEMFPQKKNNTAQTTTSKPTIRVATEPIHETTTKAVNKGYEIKVPVDNVVGDYPKYVANELVKHEQKSEKTDDNETEASTNHENREPRLFDSMPEFTTLSVTTTTKENKHPTWRVIPNPKLRPVSVRGNYEEIPISNILNRPLENNINDVYIVDERDSTIIHQKKYHVAGVDSRPKEVFGNFKKIPMGVKSAIIISGIILAVATFGFLSLLISCRVRQKRTLLKAKQELMCDHLQNDELMTSQQSLSPVLSKHQQQVYNPHHQHHSHHNPHNRHYYLWRTIRRTFRYD